MNQNIQPNLGLGLCNYSDSESDTETNQPILSRQIHTEVSHFSKSPVKSVVKNSGPTSILKKKK